jgi:hypothetical protein
VRAELAELEGQKRELGARIDALAKGDHEVDKARVPRLRRRAAAAALAGGLCALPSCGAPPPRVACVQK